MDRPLSILTKFYLNEKREAYDPIRVYVFPEFNEPYISRLLDIPYLAS